MKAPSRGRGTSTLMMRESRDRVRLASAPQTSEGRSVRAMEV